MPPNVALAHPLKRLTGRDPHEPGRVANSLELLYDLTFVVAFSVAGTQFAHLASQGAWGLAIFGYAFALFGTIWAWINTAWFVSAFDTDDWLFRSMIMVQMVGVVIFALGLEPFFTSLEHDHGAHVDTTVVVAGYVVMRLGLGVQWIRVAVDSPKVRTTAVRYLISLTSVQVGWVALSLSHPSVQTLMVVGPLFAILEMLGPYWAERGRSGKGSPWHPHHIAERYGLIFLITLGEGVVGTVVALSGAVSTAGGWTLQAGLVVVAGIAMTFAQWWVYFGVSWGDALAAHPERGFEWGYGQMVLLGGVAGIGAGLHMVGYVIKGEATIGPIAAVEAVVVPLGIATIAALALFNLMYRTIDLFHGFLLAGVAVILVGAVVAVRAGLGFGWALMIAALAPVLLVVAYETVGHGHQTEFLARSRVTSRH